MYGEVVPSTPILPPRHKHLDNIRQPIPSPVYERFPTTCSTAIQFPANLANKHFQMFPIPVQPDTYHN